MNAISLLKQDHRNVEMLFDRFAHTPADDEATRNDIVAKLIEHLSVHAAIEEEVFYPAVSTAVPDLAGNVLTCREEHHVMKWLLDDLAKNDTTSDSARLDAKVHVLQTTVSHHVSDEEEILFSRVLDAVPLERLNEIGETLTVAKQFAPTRPHPRLPDRPPLNVLLGTAFSLVDKAVQTGRQTVHRVLHPSA